MSEYTRRILVFSALAVILGISLSVGIALLPSRTAASSATTQLSTLTSISTVTGAATTITVSSVSTSALVSSSFSTNTGTAVSTTVVSGTTAVSSSSTVVTESSSGTNSTVTETSSTTSGVFCPPISGLYPISLQVLNDSGVPISGLQISGETVNTVNGQMCEYPVAADTNSTGSAFLGFIPGYYYLSFSYFGASYNLTIPAAPIVTELIATYYVPSGNLTVDYYCVNNGQQVCSS